MKRVTLASGIELDVVDVGPADAPALIFLHGFPESHRTWRHQIAHLSDRFRCIAPTGLNGRLVDLSLNGALLECDSDPNCSAGDLVELLLELEEARPFAVHARVAHKVARRLGIEFSEIEQPAFEQLSDLVLSLKRAPTIAKMLVDPN